MDDQQHAGTIPTKRPTVSGAANVFERTVVSVLTLLAAGFQSAVLMLVAPGLFARKVVDDAPGLAPPYSFLLSTLLLAGIGVRMAVAFMGRSVDHTLLSKMAQAAGSITLENLFVLTVPCIILVAMAGSGVARWTLPDVPFQKNPIVRVLCYTSGLQFGLIGSACVFCLLVKGIKGTSSVLPEWEFDRAMLAGVAILILMSSLPTFYMIRLVGTTTWARYRISAFPLSVAASIAILLSVSITNSISFDLESSINEALMHHQNERLAGVTIALRTLDSRLVQAPDGSPTIEMTVAMVNVSDKPIVVPRPHHLQHAIDRHLQPIRIRSCSSDATDPAGWTIPPAATQLVRWNLDVPHWLSDPDHANRALPVEFACFPLNGTDDVFREDPVGEAQIVLGELNWPMLAARKIHDGQLRENVAEAREASVH